MNAPNPPEIVFDLSHEMPVLQALTDLGYRPGHVDRNVDLHLGLVALGAYPADVDEFAVMNLALHGVRALCRARHAGWEPVIGKNRRLDPLHPASWHIGPGGDGDPMQPMSWHIGPGGVGNGPEAIQTGHAWERPNGQDGKYIRIGLLDTGIYMDQLKGFDILPRDGADRWGPVHHVPAWEGHATFVAGCILRQAPGATLVVDSVFEKNRGDAASWDVARKMASFAYEHSVDVLNLSLGCTTEDGQPPLVLWRAVQVLTPTVQVVAATGNEPTDDEAGRIGYTKRQPVWPAACPEAISVAASVDSGSDRLADFSPHRVPWADLVAPGVGITSAYVDGTVYVPDEGDYKQFDGYAQWSGTSFAAGTVSGTLAANFTQEQDPAKRRDVVQKLRSVGGGGLDVRNESIRPYPG